MRKITSWLFVSLDGVTESPENWVMYNDAMDAVITGEAEAADALLLGRRTYDVFAGSWPDRTTDDDHLADWMNNTAKLVVSSNPLTPEWNNSTRLDGDITKELGRVREQPGKNILMNGSSTLVRSLLRDSLLDELHLFVHPIVLGSGKRLFEDGGDRLTLEFAESQPMGNGVLLLTYRPSAEGAG
jgi:dihydrofolate reductase